MLMRGASLVAPMADHRPRSSYELDNVPWSKAVTRRAMTTAIGRNFVRDTSHRINYRLSCVSY